MCMHCWRIPPGASSRSRTSTFFAPSPFAATAAARPAGPAPMTATSTEEPTECESPAESRFLSSAGAVLRDFRNASGGSPSSAESISMRRGVQKPP